MCTDFSYLSDQVQKELRCIAETLLVPGKGILTADESTSTLGKRLQELGMNNDEDTRRRWRLLLFSTDDRICEYISGVVLIDETLYQKDNNGKRLVDYLKERCIIPGIKVDSGLVCLPGSDNEVITQGMDDLSSRLAKYKQQGCEFARWRCVFKIGQNTPSHRAIISNADELARFASICQSQRICPLIEPEVVPEGSHDIQRCQQVTEKVLSFVFRALNEHQVFLEGTVLKPNMVTAGMAQSQRSNPEAIARATMTALQRTVPPAVPGITFSSGGQTEEEATSNLHAIVCLDMGKKPWHLTFAFGRALQASAMRAWKGNPSNITIAQGEFLRRAEANGDATSGIAENAKSSTTFSPRTPTTSNRRRSDTFINTPSPDPNGYTKIESPKSTPKMSPPKLKNHKKPKRGIFSFLKRKDSSVEREESSLSPSTPPRRRHSSLLRDDEGDVIEPVSVIAQKQKAEEEHLPKTTPKLPPSSPRTPKCKPTRHSPRRTSRPIVGISDRVAPTYRPDPDPDRLGPKPELLNDWKIGVEKTGHKFEATWDTTMKEWNESVTTCKSCLPNDKLIVPSKFDFKFLNDFRIPKGMRISDTIRLPLQLALPPVANISAEPAIIEEIPETPNETEIFDQ